MKLVPFSRKIQASFGVVKTKRGYMIDKNRLVDDKKYQSKDVPKKEKAVKPKKVVVEKPDSAQKASARDIAVGLY